MGYSVWGIARFGEPYSHYDRCVVAWGGVLAQLLVALPLIVVSELIGPTKYASVNTVLGMFGFFSLFIAAFNLIPASLLDGSIAWGLVPALFTSYVRDRAGKRTKSRES
jgi:Zn-dependent protease